MSGIGGIGGGNAYQAILQRAADRRTDQQPAAEGTRTRQAGPTSDPLLSREVRSPSAPGESGLASSIDTALQQVSDLQHQADKMVIDLATGQDTNIHNTMVELEKADIALKFTVQLRNRALSAYEELMRIQV